MEVYRLSVHSFVPFICMSESLFMTPKPFMFLVGLHDGKK
jgi:hypothetical protein